MRSFVAIKVPSFSGLVKMVNALSCLPGVKAVEPHNLHLTLKFLGDINEDRMELVARSLSARDFGGPFEVSLKGVGVFPGRGRPRVVWVGLEKGKDRIRDIWGEVESATRFTPGEGNFVPHVTVSRIKRGCDVGKVLKVVKEFDGFFFGSFKVDRVVLFSSTLTPRGPIYTPLKEFFLG